MFLPGRYLHHTELNYVPSAAAVRLRCADSGGRFSFGLDGNLFETEDLCVRAIRIVVFVLFCNTNLMHRDVFLMVFFDPAEFCPGKTGI